MNQMYLSTKIKSMVQINRKKSTNKDFLTSMKKFQHCCPCQFKEQNTTGDNHNK